MPSFTGIRSPGPTRPAEAPRATPREHAGAARAPWRPLKLAAARLKDQKHRVDADAGAVQEIQEIWSSVAMLRVLKALFTVASVRRSKPTRGAGGRHQTGRQRAAGNQTDGFTARCVVNSPRYPSMRVPSFTTAGSAPCRPWFPRPIGQGELPAPTSSRARGGLPMGPVSRRFGRAAPVGGGLAVWELRGTRSRRGEHWTVRKVAVDWAVEGVVWLRGVLFGSSGLKIGLPSTGAGLHSTLRCVRRTGWIGPGHPGGHACSRRFGRAERARGVATG